jgi:hypothetical protein
MPRSASGAMRNEGKAPIAAASLKEKKAKRMTCYVGEKYRKLV